MNPRNAEYEKQLIAWILDDPWRMSCLQMVKTVMGDKGWIGGGFIRHLVWDHLGGKEGLLLNDVDVIYAGSGSKEVQNDYESQLNLLDHTVSWEVRDQAIMAAKRGHQNYYGLNEALSCWIETCTAVAVQRSGDELRFIAPFGLEDLFLGILRPGADDRLEKMLARSREKGWLEQYPFLRIAT